LHPTARVLGVLRPTTEIIGNYTSTNSIGILATNGTVLSRSYEKEIEIFFPNVKIEQEACPMWVPLVENNEHHSEGADYFVQKHINNIVEQNKTISTVLNKERGTRLEGSFGNEKNHYLLQKVMQEMPSLKSAGYFLE
jgi:glutamate racemase